MSRPGHWRRHDPDADEARTLAAVRGERAMAWARTRDGALVVVTDQALHHDAGGTALRLPWDRVARATWEEDTCVVVGSAGAGEPAVTLSLVLDEPGDVPDLVRAQVTSNIVVAQRIQSPEQGGAWVTARRVPGSEEVRWTVVFDPGVDPRDPGRRAWADRHVAALRDATGV